MERSRTTAQRAGPTAGKPSESADGDALATISRLAAHREAPQCSLSVYLEVGENVVELRAYELPKIIFRGPDLKPTLGWCKANASTKLHPAGV